MNTTTIEANIITEINWRVIPLAQKTPLIKEWAHNASSDPQILKRWTEKFKKTNIGVVTGAISGVVVLDADPCNSGKKSLMSLEKTYDELPKSDLSRTGGGSRYIFFKYPNELLQNSSSAFGEGLNILGDGEVFVVTTSNQYDGSSIYWRKGSELFTKSLGNPSDWLRGLTRSKTKKLAPELSRYEKNSWVFNDPSNDDSTREYLITQ